MLQPRAARTAGSSWRGLDIVWILCADHVFWYPWLLSTSVYRRASACCRVHHASTSSSVRGTSTSRDRGASTSGRVHCASASRILRGASSSCVRCASASGGVHRASACHDRGASTSGRVHSASACRVIRCTSTCRNRGASTSVVEYIAPAPAVTYAPTASTLSRIPASVGASLLLLWCRRAPLSVGDIRFLSWQCRFLIDSNPTSKG